MNEEALEALRRLWIAVNLQVYKDGYPKNNPVDDFEKVKEALQNGQRQDS